MALVRLLSIAAQPVSLFPASLPLLLFPCLSSNFISCANSIASETASKNYSYTRPTSFFLFRNGYMCTIRVSSSRSGRSEIGNAKHFLHLKQLGYTYLHDL
ncbi:hypothetical protein HDV64DRAFT_132295 [Trichoderma sp. TUCIM 5745]